MSKLSRYRRKPSILDNMPGLFDLPAGGVDEDLPMFDSRTLERPQHLRFMSFGSGSSGNCSYLGSEKCGVLIDAGVHYKYVMEQLALNSIDPRTIKGILITHDHRDHVAYAYALLRENRHFRVYATPKTLRGIFMRHNVSKRLSDFHTSIFKEIPFEIGDMRFTAFDTSHDGLDNCGFFVETLGTKFVITTDTGKITERADYYMRQATHMVVESNYDLNMLRHGPYPAHLKARIESETGHLDNHVTAEYLAKTIRPELRSIFLCHLSEENNTPELALEATRSALLAVGCDLTDISSPLERRDGRVLLAALPRKMASPLVILEEEKKDLQREAL